MAGTVHDAGSGRGSSKREVVLVCVADSRQIPFGPTPSHAGRLVIEKANESTRRDLDRLFPLLGDVEREQGFIQRIAGFLDIQRLGHQGETGAVFGERAVTLLAQRLMIFKNLIRYC